MKTFRLTILAFFLVSSVVVISKPATSAMTTVEAQQKLFKDFKVNLVKWSAMNDMDDDSPVDFIVYCKVDDNSNVKIMRIMGGNLSLKDRVVEIMDQHPIQASSVLQGANVAFKLRFEIK